MKTLKNSRSLFKELKTFGIEEDRLKEIENLLMP